MGSVPMYLKISQLWTVYNWTSNLIYQNKTGGKKFREIPSSCWECSNAPRMLNMQHFVKIGVFFSWQFIHEHKRVPISVLSSQNGMNKSNFLQWFYVRSRSIGDLVRTTHTPRSHITVRSKKNCPRFIMTQQLADWLVTKVLAEKYY